MKKNYCYARFFLLLIVCFLNKNIIAQKQSSNRIDSLVRVLQYAKEDVNKANMLYDVAFYYQTNNPDLSFQFATKALYLYEELKLQGGIARSNEIIAHFFLITDNESNALVHYFKAKQIYEQQGDADGIGHSLLSIGHAYRSLEDNETGLKYYEKASNHYTERKQDGGLASVFINIAYLYSSQKDFLKSRKYVLKTLEIYKRLGEEESIASTVRDLANNHGHLHDFNKALDLHQQALTMYESMRDTFHIAVVFQNIGEFVYLEDSAYSNALGYFFKALKLFKTINDKTWTADCYGYIGITFLHIAKYHNKVDNLKANAEDRANALKKAEENFNKAISIRRELKSIGYIESLYSLLAEVAELQKDYRKAADFYKKAMLIRDSITQTGKSLSVTRNEMINDFERKEQIVRSEIERQKIIRNSIVVVAGVIILSSFLIFFFYKRRRDAVQKQKETTLNLQVSETEMKALRSQMNPHFIFNALQSIKTFLNNHQSGEANTYLLKFARLMRAVLENSQYSEVSLQKDKEALELYMELESIRLTYPFTYRFHIDKSVDMEETTIPPLLLQPFVENAIWHGLQQKPVAGHIEIHISQNNDTLYATVEDNGVGRDISKKIRQHPLIKKESLGMKLTEERLKILNELKKTNAGFTITDLFTKDNQPAGTKVELSLPLAG